MFSALYSISLRTTVEYNVSFCVSEASSIQQEECTYYTQPSFSTNIFVLAEGAVTKF